MKRKYISPELEMIRFTLKDVVLSSPTDTIGEQIDNPELPGGDSSELTGGDL
jgi:hypothetical protein